MKTIEGNELLEKIKNDIPYTFGFLAEDIEKYINGTTSMSKVEKEIKDLLINMEIATSPASTREIGQVEEESKYLVELLLESKI